jgi:membrane-associated phospholipid phosphatase
MTKYPIIVFALLLSSVSLLAQSPYHFDWEQEMKYGAKGVQTVLTGRLLSKTIDLYSPDDLTGFSRSQINRFDRIATYHSSADAAKHSDILLEGSHLLPALLLLNKRTRSDFGRIAILYGESYLLLSGVTMIAKSGVGRPRPLVFNEAFDEGSKTKLSARYSFFSGHTAFTAANTFFMAKVFSDYFPDSKWKPWIWGAAATIPALTAYCRIKAGKHYPTDVLVGYGVGAAIGTLIPHLHKRRNPEKSNWTFSPGFGGASLSLSF